MDKEVKEKWVAALRSGEYEQGWHLLKYKEKDSDKERFCCLGVLCEVLKLPSEKIRNHYVYKYKDKTGLNGLPISLQTKLAMTDHEHFKLTVMNDGEGANFEQIANWIEKNM